MDFSGTQIVFVTGKGGVGKSAVAAAIAFREAAKGRKTLLVELGDRSFYGPYFGVPSIDQAPISLAQNVDVARWSRDDCLREYVMHYLRIETVFKIFFQNKIMQTFLNTAPAVSELALTGKLTSGIRRVGPELNYDCIVVDAFATGHALALIRGPQGISQAVPVGPLGENSRDIFEILTNPSYCTYVVVALPETLPVVEATELSNELRASFGLKAHVVCNRILQPPVTANEIEQLKLEQKSKDGFGSFLNYLSFKLKRQQKMLEELRQIRSDVYGVPLIPDSENQTTMIHKMSEYLSRPWTAS